jgi:hypothetical protein
MAVDYRATKSVQSFDFRHIRLGEMPVVIVSVMTYTDNDKINYSHPLQMTTWSNVSVLTFEASSTPVKNLYDTSHFVLRWPLPLLFTRVTFVLK